MPLNNFNGVIQIIIYSDKFVTNIIECLIFLPTHRVYIRLNNFNSVIQITIYSEKSETNIIECLIFLQTHRVFMP